MWMTELYQPLSFLHKGLLLLSGKHRVQHFQCSKTVEMYMLTEIDIRKSTSPYESHYPVIAQLLTHKIVH